MQRYFSLGVIMPKTAFKSEIFDFETALESVY